jgi:hypothetical protein
MATWKGRTRFLAFGVFGVFWMVRFGTQHETTDVSHFESSQESRASLSTDLETV